jgi:hypothetical protein
VSHFPRKNFPKIEKSLTSWKFMLYYKQAGVSNCHVTLKPREVGDDVEVPRIELWDDET